MIHIDFQGGAHGNYLEFVCNKFLASVFLSAEGEANISLGRSPRKMEQNFGQG